MTRVRSWAEGMLPGDVRPVYTMGECEIDLARRELRVSGSPVPLGGRAFEIVEVLTRSAGELVTKNELMDRIWPGAIVMENTLQVHAAAVRRALGAYRDLLKTEAGRGYRLLGKWTVRHHDAERPPVGLQPALTDNAPPIATFPIAATALIGRSAEAARLQDLLSAYRAVTLTGPGGIGKTALATTVARNVLGDFSDGGGVVELASLSDPDLVPAAVARVVEAQGGDRITAETVARAIGNRQFLLVLDNCEHVIDAVANLTDILVHRCPRTVVLATSREPLRVAGETVMQLPPLEVPTSGLDHPDHILDQSAVQLFLARTAARDFSLKAEMLPEIAGICRHLDGIPLAIEFAAARVATLGVNVVATNLSDRFALLTSGRRGAPTRHRTLRAVLDWSYALLPDIERVLLRRLATFPGGFTIEAAVAVMQGTGVDTSAVIDSVSSLVTKSLVTSDGSTGGRWRLLETTRAYAMKKLEESDEAGQAMRAHATFFRDLTVSAEPVSRSDRALTGLAVCLREIDNVRAALDWSFSAVGDTAIGVALTAAYVPVWLNSGMLAASTAQLRRDPDNLELGRNVRERLLLQVPVWGNPGFLGESRKRAGRALEHIDQDTNLSGQLLLQLHMGFGITAVFAMESRERTQKILSAALEIAEALDDRDALGRPLYGLWLLYFYTGENRVAFSLAQRISAIAQSGGEPFAVGNAERLIGSTLHSEGDQIGARTSLERAIKQSVVRSTPSSGFQASAEHQVYSRAYLARALMLGGQLDQASQQARESLDAANATGFGLVVCQALRIAVCPVGLVTGDLAMAERGIASLIDGADRFNVPFYKTAARCLEGKVLIEKGAFGEGTTLLRSELDACKRSGWTNCYPEFLGVLAEGLAALGRFGEALASIDEALAKADGGGERYYVAELHRLKGEFLLAASGAMDITEIDYCFSSALTIAEAQGALLFALRAAVSLAQLRMRQRLPGEAREFLEPVYGRFVEGFDTPDLRSASELLAKLDSTST